MTFAEWWHKIGSGIIPRLNENMYEHAMRVSEAAWIAADPSIVNDDSEYLPFLAVANNELKGPLGDTITCPHCGEDHPITFGNEIKLDGTSVPSKTLSFYDCGDKSYLCGINGRVI